MDPRRLRRRAGDRHRRREPRRLPRGELRAQAGRPVSARARPVRQLRPRRMVRMGRARRRRLLQQPDGLPGAHGRRPPGLAARPAEHPARLRPGAVGGHHRRARELQAAGRRCCPRRASATSWTCGATTSRTTGRPGARSSRIICHGSADGPVRAPHRPAARHRGGLANGVRDARLPARPDRGRLGRAPPRGHGAHHDGAVRPARQAALRPRRRPARLLVLPPARVAEEGRPDGRRLPAEQPVHVPVDGEARRLLRDAAAGAEGAAHRARPAQEPARQRPLRLHRGQVQPALRPRRDRGLRRLPAVHEALRRRAVGRRQPHHATAPSCTAPTTPRASG